MIYETVKGLKATRSNLGRLGLVLAGGRRLWNEADVDGAEVLASHPELELPERFAPKSTVRRIFTEAKIRRS